MHWTLRENWLPWLVGGVLVLVPPAIEGIGEAIDHCGRSRSFIVCPTHDLPPVDLPHTDHPLPLIWSPQTISPLNVPTTISPSALLPK